MVSDTAFQIWPVGTMKSMVGPWHFTEYVMDMYMVVYMYYVHTHRTLKAPVYKGNVNIHLGEVYF